MSGDTVSFWQPADDHWTLFDVRRDELPEVLLVNDGLRDFEHREIFPWHLRITIFADDLIENGMPAPDDRELLDEIGDEIENALAGAVTVLGAPNVLQLARSTWKGSRELFLRVHNAEIANGVLQGKLTEKQWARVWEFRMEADAEWTLVAPLLAFYPSN